MKELVLTRGFAAIVDDEDYVRLAPFKWTADVRSNGVYARRNEQDESGRTRKIYLHRAILGITDSAVVVDHRDNNPLNNTRCNLRVCCREENMANQSVRGDGTSSFKGVYWHKAARKWAATVGRGKGRHLGLFGSQEEAARAYDKAARQLFGEFAKCNFS